MPPAFLITSMCGPFQTFHLRLWPADRLWRADHQALGFSSELEPIILSPDGFDPLQEFLEIIQGESPVAALADAVAWYKTFVAPIAQRIWVYAQDECRLPNRHQFGECYFFGIFNSQSISSYLTAQHLTFSSFSLQKL